MKMEVDRRDIEYQKEKANYSLLDSPTFFRRRERFDY